MKKDLYMKKPFPVKSDDLKFDGKNLIIPSYYTDVLLDYLNEVDPKNMEQADADDFMSFKDFLFSVQEYKNQGN